MTGEVWRDIPGAPDYQASSLGRIRHLRTRRDGEVVPRILKLTEGGRGYLCVRVGARTELAHHLVIRAFVGRRPHPSKLAAFRDGNKQNLKPTNLVWWTPREIAATVATRGSAPRGEKNGNARLTEELVRDIRKETTLSPSELARIYEVSESVIHNVRSRRTWRHVK